MQEHVNHKSRFKMKNAISELRWRLYIVLSEFHYAKNFAYGIARTCSQLGHLAAPSNYGEILSPAFKKRTVRYSNIYFYSQLFFSAGLSSLSYLRKTFDAQHCQSWQLGYLRLSGNSAHGSA